MNSILIADDEVIELKSLKRRLERFLGENWTILTAGNGREALAQYEKYRPQILVLDICMPVVSGLEAAEEIRRKDRYSQIIFLTAYNEFDFARKAISVRALEYLLKPCEDQELESAVEEAVRLTQDHEEMPPAPERKMAAQMPDPDTRQDRIREYLEQNYGKNISLQTAAEHFGYADAYFCKLFRQYFGRSFISYLTGMRIDKAKELMRHENLTIREIGQQVGYPDSNYFAKVFKRVTGKSPSEYRGY